MKQNIKLINADVIDGLQSIVTDSIDTIITSPPYWNLRDYGCDGQIGRESTIDEYHDRLLEVTAELKRVMKPSGVLFWNHGDSYGGAQGRGIGKGNEHDQMLPQKGTGAKCLTMQNERLIMQMIDKQGWTLRNRIIWHKSNGMPSSVMDRFTNKYESVYMLVKNKKYWFDLDAVRVPVKSKSPGMKNPGDVWTVPTQPHKDAHFAIFPDKLVIPMIKAGCPAEVCPVCGFIRERITERIDSGYNGTSHQFGDKAHGGMKTNTNCKQSPSHTTETTGWTSCECKAGWKPGIVLDPFAGSGTTMKNAKKLGRSTIGIELSAEYCDIVKRNLSFHQHTFDDVVNVYENGD